MPQFVNVIAEPCAAHGLCAEMLPEWITLDEWGYPILDGHEMPDGLVKDARRAAKACPTLALLIGADDGVPVGGRRPARTR